MAEQVDVSVVIVTYRSRSDIDRCLNSLRAQTTASIEIIVVDNASDDGTHSHVEANHPDVILEHSATNLGFAKGVNLGASLGTGRYLLLLNPDTELTSPAVDELLAVASARPEARIYGGVTVDHDGTPDDLGGSRLPSLWSLACFATGLTTFARRSRLFNPTWVQAPDGADPVGVPAVSGALQLIDRELWLELDGLDERYFMYGEDIDWALRAGRAGAEPLLVPTARIVHEVGGSSTSENKRVMVLRGGATLLRTHWSAPRRELGLVLLRGATVLRGPLANAARRLVRHPVDTTWQEAWRRRREWLPGW